VWDFTGRIVDCEREYQSLNENLRGLITFHHFVSYKNPSWNKDKVMLMCYADIIVLCIL
jgi:hypothetical protein